MSDVIPCRFPPIGHGTVTAASIRGAAADLDCWLWRWPSLTPVERSDDPDVLSAFDSMIDSGIT